MAQLIDEYKKAGFKPERVNREYEETHLAIMDAAHNLLESTGKILSYRAIAEESKYHIQTVKNHYKDMRFAVDIKPFYKKYMPEIINRHLELMRQNDNLKIALEATLTLEERICDIVSKVDSKTIDITDNRTTKLIVEIDDNKKRLEVNNIPSAEIVSED